MKNHNVISTANLLMCNAMETFTMAVLDIMSHLYELKAVELSKSRVMGHFLSDLDLHVNFLFLLVMN